MLTNKIVSSAEFKLRTELVGLGYNFTFPSIVKSLIPTVGVKGNGTKFPPLDNAAYKPNAACPGAGAKKPDANTVIAALVNPNVCNGAS